MGAGVGKSLGRRMITVALAIVIAAPGCATGGVRTAAPAEPRVTDPALFREFLERLPAGTAVRVQRRNADPVRGTLMRVSEDRIVVQPRTRIPEPPVEVLLADILSVEPERHGGGPSFAKAIGAGAAAGAGAALAVFLVLVSLIDD